MEYIFYGKIIPSFKRVSFTIKDPPLRMTFDHKIGTFNFTLLLNNTEDIVVIIESVDEIQDVATLLDIVRTYSQSFYDTAFLNTGVLCSIIFSSLLLNKTLHQINIQDQSSWLQQGIFDFETEVLFGFTTNHVVRIAKADIKYACLEPDLTALFSYRAIECIMNSFNEEKEENRKKNWAVLRENLNINREFFKNVEDLSKFNRHGKPFEQSFLDRQVCIYTAMITLQRYMHYLNGGKNKLPIEKFPEIKSLKDFGILELK